MKKIIAIAMLAVLSACDMGEMVAVNTVQMTVEAAKESKRRFWVTLVAEDGSRFEQVRIGSKRCRYGPENLTVGRRIDVIVQAHRYDDGRIVQTIDRWDLRQRFCNEAGK